MKYALFSSGGKDSILALDRARARGLEVSYLVNLYDARSDRVRFHGVRKEAIALQAAALGIELLQKSVHPETFEQTFRSTLEGLRRLGIGGIVFGNIHLADVRAWYEQRTTEMGFQHLEPLWGEEPGVLIREFLRRGHRARVVSINLGSGRREWLGRDLSPEFILELERCGDVDACGERGEYHTFVFGGPLFEVPLILSAESQLEIENHANLDFTASAAASPTIAS